MPSRRTQEGDFKDIVHPIHSGFREELSKAVLGKYLEAIEERKESGTGERDSMFQGNMIDRNMIAEAT
jgi:stage V sporulation protein G